MNKLSLHIIGVLLGGLDGLKLLVRKGEKRGFLMPPDYSYFEEVPKYISDAALIKYGYTPISVKINSQEELKEFLKKSGK